MTTYRLLEINNKLINDGETYWVIEKQTWLGYWTIYFKEHSENGAIFYFKDDAFKWFNYYTNSKPTITKKIIALRNV